MSTYKVIQDIEAEDKLLGPLTLRQFIYAMITAACGYFSFLFYSKGVPYLMPVTIIPGAVTLFFAIPWSKQQPTEVWALAKIRFYFKPRKRLWDQLGAAQLVTVTAPKHAEVQQANTLTQRDVQSRLQALANTLDSRGWAVKNVNLNEYAAAEQASDRLVSASTLPQQVPDTNIRLEDDILDASHNPVAAQMDELILAQARARREQIAQNMQHAAGTVGPTTPTLDNNGWFQLPAEQPVIEATPEELAIAEQAKARKAQQDQAATSGMRTIQPVEEAAPVATNVQQSVATMPLPPAPVQPSQTAQPTAKPAVTPIPDPAILQYVNRDDLTVGTIQREAQKAKESSSDEVVISLR